jgi:hypothetical protein
MARRPAGILRTASHVMTRRPNLPLFRLANSIAYAGVGIRKIATGGTKSATSQIALMPNLTGRQRT